MQATPMDDHYVLSHQDNDTMSADEDVPGQGAQKTAFFVLWSGVFLLLLLWMWMGLKAFIQATLPDPGRHEDHEATNAEVGLHKMTKNQRRQRLVNYFQNGKHEVEVTDEILPKSEDDGCPSSNGEKTVDGDDYDEESNEQLIHLKLSGDDSERVFPNYCAICLELYKTGDHIVWSCSQECRHVFHRECLISGLIRVKDNTSPCPCCRMQFCDFPKTPSTDDATNSCESN